DVPPEITDGRTLLPLRFFSENLGCTVDWLAEQRMIKINSPPQKMLVSAFYALGSGQTSSWKNLFNKDFPETEQGNTNLVRKIALGWYSLDQNGNLLTKSTTGWQRPAGWEKVLEAANKYQIKTEMVVHMTDKESALSNLIADPIAINQAIANISKEAPLYDGVNLDLEGLGWRESGEMLENTRTNFTHFVQLLYVKLTAQGLTLTLTLHAPNSAYPGYDYENLGNNCDEIIIMAYDYGSKPEPPELVSAAVEKALNLVPAKKLILGISIPSENTASLPTKIGIAKRYQLKGIALWRLGLVTQEMWQVLHENILPLTVN
ncbi:MAG TPA: copper amine oxidase, partial [Clostridia bacterium]|nr:copper amine oxidase [Clostridia bacterium]